MPDSLNTENAVRLTNAAAKELFQSANRIIDNQFGVGYSSKNPLLLAALITSHTAVYSTLAKDS